MIRAAKPLASNYVDGIGYIRPVNPNRIINIIGNFYGELLVLECVGKARKRTIWKCKCSCGNETLVPLHRLHAKPPNNWTHCGCRSKEC